MQRPMTGLWVLLFGLLVWLAAAWADTLTVTVSRANVRQGPGLSHGVMATLPRGATFPVLKTEGGWRQIQLDDGRHAWIADSVVRVESSGLPERGLERRPKAALQRRVALVIGNAAYADSPLRNPVNDATDMAAMLRQLGFEVQLLRDASRRQMQDAVRAFGRGLALGGVGLFYYAGHGLQVAGQNYLVPIGADIKAEFDVEHETVSAGWILGAMEYAGNGLNLVILDACRNNPFSRGFRGRSALGLAAPAQSAKGSLIAYATSPNAVADDGAGRNGLYTKHLLRYMKEPGLGVEEMFKHVRIAVEEESEGQQTPWELSSLTGDFSFTVASTVGPGGSGDAERRRLEAERQRVESERQRLAAERQLLEEQRRLAEEKKRLEAEAERRQQMEPGRRFRDGCDGCPEMVVVPAGSFRMGSPPGEATRFEYRFGEYEYPQHLVAIAEPFAVGVHEVTRGEFARFVRASNRSLGNSCRIWDSDKRAIVVRSGRNWRNPGFAQTDRHPVVCVSWDDARAYVLWLTRETGEHYRLLSESEWEYVARGGTLAGWYWGENFQEQCSHANGADASTGFDWGVSCNDGHARTAPVGTYEKNGFGVHDVLGNVWEWVEDCWNEQYVGAPADSRAWKSGDCNRRVVRGGSWYNVPWELRAAVRYRSSTGYSSSLLGFRVARTLTP